MLRQLQAIEVPSWLTSLTPDSINLAPVPLHELLRESLFYPSSGFDGDPIKHMGGNVLSFVYADYGHNLNAFISALHFTGYDLVASRDVTENELAPDGWRPLELRRVDGDPLRYSDQIKGPFCVWSIFQRRGDFSVTHGPVRFSLLFICADGVATFQALYLANSIIPKAVAVIQPGHGFGYNWSDFTDPEQIFARVVLGNPVGQPEMLIYGGIGREWENYASPCWPMYKILLRRFRKTGGGTIGVWTKKMREIDPSS